MFRLPIVPNQNGGTSASASWPKPKDWLPMPEFSEGDQIFNGLLSITEYGNSVEINIAGNYTVDWGDGVVENYNAGKAAHTYDYPNINMAEIDGATKQVVVSVVPQEGSVLTSINLSTSLVPYIQSWLEINLSGTTISEVIIRDLFSLKAFDFKGKNSITNFSSFFNNCKCLSHIISLSTEGATNFFCIFYRCHLLESIPDLDASTVTNMYQMFMECFSLRKFPVFTSANSGNTSRFLMYCSALQQLPVMDTSNSTSFLSAFAYMDNLTHVPAWNIISGTDIRVMFTGSPRITRIELYNISSDIDISPCTQMSREAIVEVFTNLVDKTGTTSCSIKITGMKNLADLTIEDRNIVLNKNWTITE